jgi:peptidyl-prolyl cis-trans isomerase C
MMIQENTKKLAMHTESKKYTKSCVRYLAACLISIMASLVLTQQIVVAKEADSIEFIATVNDEPIGKKVVDLYVKNAVSQGKKDTPQLRQELKEELINRELMYQEAQRLGLENDPDIEIQVFQLRQTLAIQALIDRYLKENPITEARLLEEYKKQTSGAGALKNGENTSTQYQISQIVLNTEAEAIATQARLQAGESFAKLAQEVSIDTNTKKSGGVAGWIELSQLSELSPEIIAGLNKGDITKPQRIYGKWFIIKLDNTRTIKVASYEKSKNQLQQIIIQGHLTQLIKSLKSNARISQ